MCTVKTQPRPQRICKDGFFNSIPGKHRKTLGFDSLFKKVSGQGSESKKILLHKCILVDF